MHLITCLTNLFGNDYCPAIEVTARIELRRLAVGNPYNERMVSHRHTVN